MFHCVLAVEVLYLSAAQEILSTTVLRRAWSNPPRPRRALTPLLKTKVHRVCIFWLGAIDRGKGLHVTVLGNFDHFV